MRKPSVSPKIDFISYMDNPEEGFLANIPPLSYVLPGFGGAFVVGLFVGLRVFHLEDFSPKGLRVLAESSCQDGYHDIILDGRLLETQASFTFRGGNGIPVQEMDFSLSNS